MADLHTDSPPVFQLFSIGFGGDLTPPLPMRDLQTNQVVGLAGGGSPEWVLRRRSAPAAYPRGSTPVLQVVFQTSNVDQFPSGETYTIQATGKGGSVAPQNVPLNISPMQGFSSPVAFSLAAPLQDAVGVQTVELDWTATDDAGHTFAIGSSAHTFFVTWRELPGGAGVLAGAYPFAIVVENAVRFAAGQSTLAGVCGSLITGIQTMGIAHSVSGGDTRMLFLQKQANSAGFASLLFSMLASQGILGASRAIDVDWDNLPASALDFVPAATSSSAPAATGPHVHTITLVATGPDSVLLCDADLGVGPVALPIAMPPDAASQLTGPAFDTARAQYLVPAAARHARLDAPKLGSWVPPITIFSVHFAYQGGQAIPLHDPITDSRIGVTPEWVAGADTVHNPGSDPHTPPPAAFVRGTAITIRATFMRTLDAQHGGAAAMSLVVGATGIPVGVTDQAVDLTFDLNGRSNEVALTFDAPVSNDVGQVLLALRWHITKPGAPPQPIGTSTHPLYFTWKAMVPDAVEGLPDWAYTTLVQWTSGFAADATSDKDVCDRVFAGLSKTGLKYGVAGWTPRQMLLGGGGMCGGWYQLFQLMLHCQGVRVEKRAFLVDWRALSGAAIQWNAIVVSSGGLNQPVPPVIPTEYHDLDAFPVPAPATITTTTAQRYRFWGSPSGFSDGHCVNFFVDEGQLVLYDASFSLGPIPLQMPLPPTDKGVLGGADLADFVAKYLQVAVSHMLGSFTVNGQAYTSTIPDGPGPGVNGVTVRTSALPTMVGAVPTITFGWI